MQILSIKPKNIAQMLLQKVFFPIVLEAVHLLNAWPSWEIN